MLKFTATTLIRRQRRRPVEKWRCTNLESVLITCLVSMAMLVVAVNISMATRMEHMKMTDKEETIIKATNARIITKPHPQPSHANSKSSNDNKEPILEILRLANVTLLTDKEWEALPSWPQVLQRLGGDHPHMIGLETCETYRQRVPLARRHVAPSGMFSTGTNLLFELLHRNCVLYEQKRPRRPNNSYTGVDWQVNWGKHQSPRFRHVNYLYPTNQNNSDIFPIVMVRDPWTWLQSMCRVRYSTHWFHVSAEHCPNFIPNHVERQWFHKTKAQVRKYFHNDPWKMDDVMDKANFTLDDELSVIPVRVRYKNEMAFHDSMAHFWKDWNQEYLDAIDVHHGFDVHHGTTEDQQGSSTSSTTSGHSVFPRLMVRLEDLVFFPQQVLKDVCDCVGGQLADPLVLEGDSSKQGGENVHGSNKTDLRAAMISHIYTNRSQGMTRDDMEYASKVLKQSQVLQRLGYPPHPTQ